MPCFYGVPGFFHRLSGLWSSLFLSLHAVFSQSTAVPSLSPCSKPHYLAHNPLPNRWLTTKAGMLQCRPGVQFLLVLPSTDNLLHPSLIPCRSFSVSAYFPTVREFFWVQEPPLTFSFPPGLLAPFLIPLFFFSSFFHPTRLWDNFSCRFRCLKFSASVQQVLYENFSICRCIPDVLVRSDEFCILLFHCLDSSPDIGILIDIALKL